MMTVDLKNLLEYFQQIHPQKIDLDLSRMRRLLKVLGNPHTRLPPTLHIAGTNGKGSTLSYLRHIYEAANFRVHVYTSPHLVRYNERIRLAGTLITDDQLTFYLDKVRIANGSHDLTFFEAKTAAAFLAFCDYPADVVLLETGLGGRLDATNVVINPIACVLTPISLDHQDFLGETLEEIAHEKAGIIKPKTKVFIGSQKQEVQKILTDTATQRGAIVYTKEKEWYLKRFEETSLTELDFLGQKLILQPTLVGEHQLQNAGLAAATVSGLQRTLSVSRPAIESGIQNTVWPGRLQRLFLEDSWAEIWIDGAHNIDGFQSLRRFLEKIHKEQEKKLFFCVSMLRNRDPYLFFQVFSKIVDHFIFIPMAEHEKFHDPTYLATYTDKPTQILRFEDLTHFLQKRELDGTRIFVTGSLYLVGKVLELNKIELD